MASFFPVCPQVAEDSKKTTLYDDENDNDNDDEGGLGWFVSGGDMHLSTGGRTKEA